MCGFYWYEDLDDESLRYVRLHGWDKLPLTEAAQQMAIAYRKAMEHAHRKERQ